MNIKWDQCGLFSCIIAQCLDKFSLLSYTCLVKTTCHHIFDVIFMITPKIILSLSVFSTVQSMLFPRSNHPFPQNTRSVIKSPRSKTLNHDPPSPLAFVNLSSSVAPQNIILNYLFPTQHLHTHTSSPKHFMPSSYFSLLSLQHPPLPPSSSRQPSLP